MKKSGKPALVFLGAIGVVVLFKFMSPKKISKVKTPNYFQYKNRLNEFRIQDLDLAKNEYEEFLSMGLSPRDAFDLTVSRAIFL